jgi:hypothetical protein
VLQPHLELLLQIIEQAEEVPHSTFTAFIECVSGECFTFDDGFMIWLSGCMVFSSCWTFGNNLIVFASCI